MKKNTFIVTGMHCASCSTIIEKALKKTVGVETAQVNYAAEKAQVTFDENTTSLETMNAAVAQYGYTLALFGNETSKTEFQAIDHMNHASSVMNEDIKQEEMRMQQDKTAFVFPIALGVFAVMMWDIAGRTFVSVPNIPLSMELWNIVSLILATVVMFWIGRPFIDGVTRFVRYRVANMDTLIGIGTLTAYLYSAVITLLPQIRERFQLPDYTYFDVVIVVIGFVTLGKYLETRSKEKTGEAIKKLLNLQAKTARVLREGKEVEIPMNEVVVGEVVIVKPGEKIPVDGVIIEGTTSIDESMITGESIPTDKKAGDSVIGATMNKQGSFTFAATKVGADTMLSQIIHMVEEAQGSRAPIQATADRISSVFVPIVLAIAFLSLAAWIF
ncbi:MAG: heavy metal translocating P-type ATPase, partial [Candidatus Moranbacteria bacterium]|nr:heavy metal translocating P-type ATPase [Candidatus Moranbacteria bacterium]